MQSAHSPFDLSLSVRESVLPSFPHCPSQVSGTEATWGEEVRYILTGERRNTRNHIKDIDKAFDQIQHPFTINTLHRSGLEGASSTE